MIIVVDKEGKSVIEQLCDVGLKQAGIGNLNQINLILRSTQVFSQEELSKLVKKCKKGEKTGDN